MLTKALKGEFDVIVVGSGMGGMTMAAALSRMGRKVLLLEQAQTRGWCAPPGRAACRPDDTVCGHGR